MKEGVKITIDQLESVMRDGDDIKAIRDGLERRAELKGEEERVKDEIKNLNDELLPILAIHDISTVSSSLGSITYTEGESVNLSRDNLINAMLKRGWEASEIAQVVEEGTTRTSYVTLAFRKPPKPKKD